ncbi:hypothetical protein HZP71_02265 [Elizabethkingia anophelis]|nr:hypothetical protein [Elizabethkingia anophelis]
MVGPINYKISEEVYLENYKKIPEEYIVRNILHRLITDIPIEKLKKLINFEVLNPEDVQSWQKSENRLMLSELGYKKRVLIRGNIWI